MKKRNEEKHSEGSEGYVIGRRAFAKISAVERIALDKTAEDAFAEFDRQRLSHQERRRAIIGRFTRQS